MDDREIIAEFVTESREHLADIENQLLAIEAAGAEADSELVNTVFRAIHSIKGAAGFLGFSTVGELAHDLENVLNLVRNRQLVPDAPVTDILLRSADKLRTMIEDIDHSNCVNVSEYLDALQGVVAGLLAEEVPAPLPPAPVNGAVNSAKAAEDAEPNGEGTDEAIACGSPPASMDPSAPEAVYAERPAGSAVRELLPLCCRRAVPRTIPRPPLRRLLR